MTSASLGAPASLLQRLSTLGIVPLSGVGVDKVDLAQARRQGVPVTNTPYERRRTSPT